MASAPETIEAAIQRLDRHGYLFGQKIAASMSPLLHGTIYAELGLKWEQLRLDSADIPRFLELIKDPRCFGSSVTMPNKVAIMSYLDEVTPECRAVGACNTVFFRYVEEPSPSSPSPSTHKSRILVGANTDVTGVRESFLRNAPPSLFHARPALVLGGGGAARSAVHALRHGLHASAVYLANRDDGEVDALMRDCGGEGAALIHVRSAAEAEALEAPAAVVACIPDFPPATEGEKTAREVLKVFLRKGKRRGALLEMCYNPSPRTAITELAGKEGWQVILGTEAMIWQGLEQARLWTGREVEDLPVDKVKEVIAKKVEQVSSSSKI
ncbi:hypothetical protein F4810DRAFT_629552 [Camillea tinctor]|nr:hypothetical protein F4810DRAFT_629552 [Camillea tinctor]